MSIIASPSVLGEDIMFFYLSFKLSRYYYAKSQMKVSSKFEKKNSMVSSFSIKSAAFLLGSFFLKIKFEI